VTGLTGVAGRWFEDSMKLLFEMKPPPPPPPTTPEPAPLPTPPDKVVREGRRKVVGKSACRSLLAEVERELSDDAELELTWRIVKKRGE
jgi:hypothetical protein